MRWGSRQRLAAGGLVLLACGALLRRGAVEPVGSRACLTNAAQLPGRYHPVRSWPPAAPVRVSWKFPKAGSADVTALFRTYPLTDEMMSRALHQGSQWARRPVWRVMDRLASDQAVRVVVFGGSEAAGTGCDDGTLRYAGCSWSSRFVMWLRLAFPHARITYENYAAGGTTTAGILPALRTILATGPEPDLILVDFLVNDAFEAQDWLASRGGAYANEEQEEIMRKGGHSRLEIVQAATAILLSRLREYAPSAATILFEPLCTVRGAIARVDPRVCYETQDAHVAAADVFGVPVVSYRDVVWPASQLPEPPDDRFWCCNDTGHPRWEAHQLMADVMVHTWLEMRAGVCARKGAAFAPAPRLESIVAPDLLERFDQCRTPLTVHDAKAAAAKSGPGLANTHWRLGEDAPGKPGWIASEHGGSAASDRGLRFDLEFGASPRVIFSFLRSYEGQGSVELTFETAEDRGGSRKGLVVDGLWPEGTMPAGSAGRVSQTHTLALNVQQAEIQQRHGDAGIAGFGIKPHSKATLVVTTKRSGHFRSVSVVSC